VSRATTSRSSLFGRSRRLAGVLDARARRIAENESRFRDINERLEGGLRRLPDDGTPADFVCECGNASCAASVALTIAEYERARQDPLLFVVLPGHEIPDVEQVIAQTDRYFVVRKDPETAPIVERTDPRADQR
jgi:mannose-1-phosphate guanylyltransferase